MLILQYGCTTWTLTKRIEKNLDGNYSSILRAILNKYWKQHPTKQQLYGYLPPISKTIQIRRTRHAEHCWRSKNELISDDLQLTPSHGRPIVGRPTRTNLQQLCSDTRCSLDDLPEAMDDRDKWRERVRGIRACISTWWWWWFPQALRHERDLDISSILVFKISFPSLRLIALPRLKNRVCSTIYPRLRLMGRTDGLMPFWGALMRSKTRAYPGFELGLPDPSSKSTALLIYQE